MAITQNTYSGDGSTTNYSFTFEYLNQSDVKATLDGTATTAFTFANATTLSFTTAPASGVAIRIYRDTDIDALKATFFPGSAIKAEDLNSNFNQSNFAVQEFDIDLQTANTNASTALATANSATNTANQAATDAATAITTANSAVTTANGAVTTAIALSLLQITLLPLQTALLPRLMLLQLLLTQLLMLWRVHCHISRSQTFRHCLAVQVT